jgi:hypothetical protein
VAVDALDLSLPSRGAEAVRDPHGDQTGHQPVAVVLDLWVRDWQETRARREGLPVPTVPELVRWLRHWLEWACDEHPAVDEFAAEVRETLAALRGVLRLVEPTPEHCEGVECDRCDMRLLYRRGDGTGDVECHNVDCRRVFRADEYADWVSRLAAYERAVSAAACSLTSGHVGFTVISKP